MVSCGNWINRPKRRRREAGDSAVIKWMRISRSYKKDKNAAG